MKDAKDAYDVGLIDSPDVKGIYDLKILNQILKDKGEAAIKSECVSGNVRASLTPASAAAGCVPPPRRRTPVRLRRRSLPATTLTRPNRANVTRHGTSPFAPIFPNCLDYLDLDTGE